jgi:hypothetical protein
MFDFYFHYCNLVRFLDSLKCSNEIFTFMDIVKIKSLNVFFEMKEIKELNSFSVLNSIYFFKYYFGVLPFFTKYNYKFSLNVSYYSFVLKHDFYGKNLYFPLFFFVNDIFSCINKLSLESYKLKNSLIYMIKDMNFFLEKKSSLGFYNLKHLLGFEIISNNSNINNNKVLYSLFKLKI